jgi:hypothetical protein
MNFPHSMVNLIDRWLSAPSGFYGLLSVFVVAQFIIRGLLYPAAPTDDAEQMLFSQSLRWGYDVVNPPLYTWLVIAVQQLTGVENGSVSLIKFPAYWMIFHFLYVLGRRAIEDTRLAVMAALSPLLLYYVAWDAVLSYSHTILATALILAALAQMLRLQEKAGLSAYILLGLVLGLGMLSKYTFGFAALSMLMAGIIYRPFRARILHPGMALSLLIAGLVMMPHVYWLVQQSDEIAGAVSGKFEVGEASNFMMARLKGMGRAFSSGIGFASPLWLILLAVFWAPVRTRFEAHEYIPPPAKFLLIYMVAVIVLLAAFVMVFGVTKIRAHYMFMLIPFPVVFFAWLKPCLDGSPRVRVFGTVLVMMATLLVTGMAAKYVSEPLRCKRCQLLIPFKDIGQKIRDTGFKGGTIFAYYFPHDLAGNLRSSFPNTRIVSTKYPEIAPPPGDQPGQCLIIWMPAPSGVMNAHGMTLLLNRDLGGELPLENFPKKPIPFTYDRTKSREDKLHYMLYEPGAATGMCR